jgi:hypothetical protein
MFYQSGWGQFKVWFELFLFSLTLVATGYIFSMLWPAAPIWVAWIVFLGLGAAAGAVLWMSMNARVWVSLFDDGKDS